ncbi:MAG TPA: NYN domain-containing protein [Acetobacteraceae bacterium]|nr:NYN domain-containing protein [Acetobacteraceae bacterium]
MQKKAHYPISNRAIDFARTPTAAFRSALHDALRRLRKTALRPGHPSEGADFAGLADDDFTYDVRQKGVDMTIGIDIASLAYKRQVDQIVPVAGDADCVPAAKLARREGIDFILDPMWRPTPPSLSEHIDGLRSTCPNPHRSVAVQRSATIVGPEP